MAHGPGTLAEIHAMDKVQHSAETWLEDFIKRNYPPTEDCETEILNKLDSGSDFATALAFAECTIKGKPVSLMDYAWIYSLNRVIGALTELHVPSSKRYKKQSPYKFEPYAGAVTLITNSIMQDLSIR